MPTKTLLTPSPAGEPDSDAGHGIPARPINPLIQGTLDSLPSNVALLDGKGRVLAVNAAWRRVAEAQGLPGGAAVGREYLDVCGVASGPEGDLARRAQEGIRSVLQGQHQRFDLEYPCHSPQAQKWFALRATRFEDNRAVCGLVAHEDITERKLAELELFERNLLLDALIAGSPLALVVLDAEHRIRMCNSAFEALFGFACSEVVGRNLDDLIAPPEYQGEARNLTQQGIAGNQVNTVTKRVRKDGTLVDVEIHAVPLIVSGSLVGAYAFYKDITERVTAAEALHRAEERFSKAFQFSPDSICINTLDDGRFVEVNEGFSRLTGYTPAEVIGRTAADLELWACPQQRDEWVRQIQEHGLTREFDAGLRRKDGTIRQVLLTASMIELDGRPCILNVARDVTQQRKAEETQRRLAAILEATPDFVGMIDANQSITFMNRAGRRMVGVDESADLLGKSISSFHPQWAAWVIRQEGIPAAVRDGVWHGETALLGAGGREIPVSMVIVAHRSPDGALIGLSTVARDISERKLAEEALRLSEERFSRAFQSSPDSIAITTMRDGRYLEVNDRFTETTGYTREEAIGETAQELGLWVEPAQRAELFKRLKRDGTVRDMEVRLRIRSGEVRTGVLSAERITLGGVDCMLTVVRDITEHQQVFEALQESESRYRELVENAREVIFTADFNGRAISFNRAGEQLTGYERHEVAGFTLDATVAPLFGRGSFQALLDRLREGGCVTEEIILRARDGRSIPLEVSAHLLKQDGQAVAIQCVGRDITERRRLEEQLHQAQKMEAIGRLAGGVAHDFNNLLMVIKGYTELMTDSFHSGDPHHAHAEQVLRASDRAASLTRQLLAFSRKQVIQPKVLNLALVVQETEKMLRRLIGEDIELEVRAASHLGHVKVDSGQMEQVLLNLAVNARDAMPAGGRLLIETANVTVDETIVPPEANVQPGPYVLLSVTDTGCGMDEETKAHLFEPFFTTKEVGKGTGLGLATVYGVIRQAGGWVRVYSELGQGSTFRIYLPRVESPAAPEPVHLDDIRARNGEETILLVEDDANVRSLTREILTRAGYTVLEASHGEEGLQRAAQARGPIHLVVSDVVMPRMSGREMVERLTAQRPDLKVLFVSGYTDNIILPDDLARAEFKFLSKPFRRDALLQKVREILDARSELPAGSPAFQPADTGATIRP